MGRQALAFAGWAAGPVANYPAVGTTQTDPGFGALFLSDGTSVGTSYVGTTVNGSGGVSFNGPFEPSNSFSQSPDITSLNGSILLSGSDTWGGGLGGTNIGLWVSRGTSSTTAELTGISGASNNGLNINPKFMTPYNGVVLFNGLDSNGANSLWVTNGSAGGTHEITGIAGASGGIALDPSNFYVLKGKVLFNGIDANDLQSLWVTDGTASGTTELTSIAGASASGLFAYSTSGPHSINPDFTAFNGKVLFVGKNSSGSLGLWETDGSSQGTHEITGITNAWAGNGGFYPSGIFETPFTSAVQAGVPGFVVFNNEVLFRGVNSHGDVGLWKTDGTAAGTNEITGISGAASGGVFNGTMTQNSPDFTVLNGTVLFEGVNATGVHGLWVTDGTASGTHELTGIAGANQQGIFSDAFLDPPDFTVFGGKAYFTGYNANGAIGLWVTDGTAAGTHEMKGISGASLSGITPGAFETVMLGSTSEDFAGGGTSGILFRNASNGETYLWSMNGATVTSGAPTSTQVGNNWQIAGVGDFDGNGTADLMWVYNNAANAADPLDGVSYVSFQNGANATSGGVVQQLSSQWQVAGVGDFDGDGKSDVLYRNSSTGQTYVDIMNGPQVDWAASGFASQQVTNPNWAIAATADFNGDGKADILWRYNNAANASDPLNGALYEWQMNGTTVTSAGLLSQQPGSANWQVVGTGDFSGDGKDDVLFRYEDAANASNPLNGLTYIEFTNGTTVTSGAPTQWQVDNGWVVAGIGDYYGTGTADILWQQTSTGNAYIWDMNGANVTSGAYTSQQAGPGWATQNGVSLHST